MPPIVYQRLLLDERFPANLKPYNGERRKPPEVVFKWLLRIDQREVVQLYTESGKELARSMRFWVVFVLPAET